MHQEQNSESVPREPRIFAKKKTLASSGAFCSAPGCSNSAGRDLKFGIKRSYHRFPSDPALFKIWEEAIPRYNWKPTRYTRICSDHFKGGKRTRAPGSDGYIPTIFYDVETSSQKQIKPSKEMYIIKKPQKAQTQTRPGESSGQSNQSSEDQCDKLLFFVDHGDQKKQPLLSTVPSAGYPSVGPTETRTTPITSGAPWAAIIPLNSVKGPIDSVKGPLNRKRRRDIEKDDTDHNYIKPAESESEITSEILQLHQQVMLSREEEDDLREKVSSPLNLNVTGKKKKKAAGKDCSTSTVEVEPMEIEPSIEEEETWPGILPKCSVKDCPNRGGYPFPKSTKRRQAWVRAVRHLGEKDKTSWKPSKDSVVCQAHFKPSAYLKDIKCGNLVKKTLHNSAIPTIFPWNTRPATRTKRAKKTPQKAESQGKTSRKLVEEMMSAQYSNTNNAVRILDQQLASLQRAVAEDQDRARQNNSRAVPEQTAADPASQSAAADQQQFPPNAEPFWDGATNSTLAASKCKKLHEFYQEEKMDKTQEPWSSCLEHTPAFALGTPLEQKIEEIRTKAAAEIVQASRTFLEDEEERLTRAQCIFFNQVEIITMRDVQDKNKAKDIIDNARETLKQLGDI